MLRTPEELAQMPAVKISCVSNLFSKMMHFKQAGNVEYGHCHIFDHLTLLASGSLKVTIDGVSTDYKAPHMIFIRKNIKHELTALEDNTVAFCIHALRRGDGIDDIIDPDSIPADAHTKSGLERDSLIHTP
jgi:dTDP-4-dehydrorhamnose 3,5-epimerase-like enzyme